ncbi:MAG: hypothetical protein WA900_10270 [Casimicrobiaceae bacterium]
MPKIGIDRIGRALGEWLVGRLIFVGFRAQDRYAVRMIRIRLRRSRCLAPFDVRRSHLVPPWSESIVPRKNAREA